MRSITGIGETVLDIVFKEDRPQAAVPGGSTFNAMISLGRTAGVRFPEVPIRMVSEVGDDHVADIITAFMARNGVDSSAVTRRKDSKSHISLAFLDADNNARYSFYKDHAHAQLDPENLSGIRFCKDDLVLFGSYFAVNPLLRSFTEGLLRTAHDSGAILYYDINFRRPHRDQLAEILPRIEENCRLSDFVRGSSEDFYILYGTDDPETVYRKYISPLCPEFICTCGPDPVHVFSHGRHMSFDAEKTHTVSTIGAGDNFNAGFVYGLLAEDIRKDECAKLSEAQWAALVRTAGRFAAEACRSLDNYVPEGFRV
ncbi:MAG: carbohydrate kinase [Bacteroidales bacterium]|nr:carbohydrate kinase [Bacteroidales bacterium]